MILTWANEHHFVVITNDLDFSAILAAGAGEAERRPNSHSGPALHEAASIVAKALEAHREDIERGALLSIGEGGTRVRMLPLKGSQVPRSRNPTPSAGPRPTLVVTVGLRLTKNRGKQIDRELCSPSGRVQNSPSTSCLGHLLSVDPAATLGQGTAQMISCAGRNVHSLSAIQPRYMRDSNAKRPKGPDGG